jgi:hypothetical protein
MPFNVGSTCSLHDWLLRDPWAWDLHIVSCRLILPDNYRCSNSLRRHILSAILTNPFNSLSHLSCWLLLCLR